MNSTFFYSFPAIKGIQASREYFVIMCPLKILSKLFIFNEDDIPAEYRAQRILNKNRIPEMANYIINNPKDYVFSSLTSSMDGEYEFTPINPELDKNIGILKVAMDSKLLINDGQHRRAAIEEALKATPEIGNETISIVLFIDEDLNRSQQIMFNLLSSGKPCMIARFGSIELDNVVNYLGRMSSKRKLLSFILYISISIPPSISI